MSHSIDIDGLDEKLFLIRHLVHGTKTYCAAEDIISEYESGCELFDNYWGQLKFLLSNYIIESAVKARMIQEFCEKDNSDGELARFEEKAIGSLSLGDVREGKFKLTLREASNKIIHSTRAIIELKDIVVGDTSYKAWDGKYHLFGKHHNNDWHLELDVEGWAKAMSAFLEILSDNEKTFYMGQDWS